MSDTKRRGRPRGPQAIFRLMINRRQYGESYVPNHTSGFMCNAISEAYRKGVITEQEHDNAREAINAYLCSSGHWEDGNTLCYVLAKHDLPNSFEDRLKIYTNWAKRPSLTGE